LEESSQTVRYHLNGVARKLPLGDRLDGGDDDQDSDTTTKTAIRLDRTARAKQARIAKALSELGLALPGSIEVRSTRCGKANCRCKADLPQLHGPYIVWARKVDAKTVTRVLSPDQFEDYRPLFDNAKRLRELVTDLQSLTLDVVGSDDRWRTR